MQDEAGGGGVLEETNKQWKAEVPGMNFWEVKAETLPSLEGFWEVGADQSREQSLNGRWLV
jgi:hypothetical protein